MEPVTTVVGAIFLAGGLSAAVWRRLHHSTHEVPTPTENSNVASSQLGITYGFSRGQEHKPKDILLKSIRSAQRSLDIAVYAFTDREIEFEVIKAHRRGVKVRLITDFRQWMQSGNQKRIVSNFVSEGITVKMNRDADAYMHLKVAIVDEASVVTGSFNYSKSASKKHEEVLLQIHNAALAQEWKRYFEDMWEDEFRYELYTEFGTRRSARTA